MTAAQLSPAKKSHALADTASVLAAVALTIIAVAVVLALALAAVSAGGHIDVRWLSSPQALARVLMHALPG